MENILSKNTSEHKPQLPLEMQVAVRIVEMHHILLIRSVETKKITIHYHDKRRYVADKSEIQIRSYIKNEIISIFNSIPKNTEEDTNVQVGSIVYEVTRESIKAYLKTGYLNKLTKQVMNNIMDFTKIVVDEDMFDSDPYKINTLNGVYDIKAKTLSPHSPADLNKNIVDANYIQTLVKDENKISDNSLSIISIFNRVLNDALYDDKLNDVENREIIRSFTEILASFLIGDNKQKLVFILLGLPNTGKSTLLEVLLGIFCDYGATFNNSALMVSSRSSNDIRPDVIALMGKRLLLGSESNKNNKLDNALLKQLSGNDKVSVRRPHSGNMVTFTLKGKLMLATNHCPKFSDLDDKASLNRIVLIDFNNVPKQFDVNLKEKLLLPESRDKIFTYLTQAANEIVERGEIFIHDRFAANKQRIFVNQSSSVSIFWKEHIRPYDDYKIPAKAMPRHPVQLLYNVMYLDFCLRHNDIKSLAFEVFAKEFKAISDKFSIPTWKKGASHQYYIGFNVEGGQAERYYYLNNQAVFDKSITFGETLFE